MRRSWKSMKTDYTALGSDISDPVLHDIYPFELDGRGCVVSDRPGSDDLSVLYRSVCLDHLLCEKAWKGDLSWTAIIFAAPVCIKDQDNAVYSWNFDIIVYSGTFGGECGIYVLRF